MVSEKGLFDTRYIVYVVPMNVCHTHNRHSSKQRHSAKPTTFFSITSMIYNKKISRPLSRITKFSIKDERLLFRGATFFVLLLI